MVGWWVTHSGVIGFDEFLRLCIRSVGIGGLGRIGLVFALGKIAWWGAGLCMGFWVLHDMMTNLSSSSSSCRIMYFLYHPGNVIISMTV